MHSIQPVLADFIGKCEKKHLYFKITATRPGIVLHVFKPSNHEIETKASGVRNILGSVRLCFKRKIIAAKPLNGTLNFELACEAIC